MSSEPIYNYFSSDIIPDIDNQNQDDNIPRTESNGERETAFESKMRRMSNKSLNNHLISGKNISIIRESLRDSTIFDNANAQNLTVRELQKISQNDYDNWKSSIIDQQSLLNLFNELKGINCNYKSIESNNSLGGLTPLTFLIENSFSMIPKKAKEMNDKYNILNKYIYNYRTINGDGNCFYRAVMFRYLEILVLNNQIEYLQNLAYDVYKSFNSEELKSRLIIGKINLKPDLTFKLLILIIDILKQRNILLAHKILVKSFSICRKFDYAIIFYFRYILYDYIKKSEEKTYMKSFPIQIGNLLPSQYETEDGKFLYESFYQNYLLKFYTDAEKIVIYLTPFVLGIPLNVLIYDASDEEILQNFKWEEGNGLNLTDEISLLNRKNHYEIVYTKKDNEKYKKIFETYENNKISVILANIDKYLKANEDDNTFQALQGNFDIKEEQINNPKTMICKRNDLSKNIPNNLQIKNNYSNENNKTDINNNERLLRSNIINGNQFNNEHIQKKLNDLNPKVNVVKNPKITNNNNINDKNYNNINISNSKDINNIKNNNNSNISKPNNMMNNNNLNNGIMKGMNNNNNQANYANNINNVQKNINGYNIKENSQIRKQVQNIPLNNNQNINEINNPLYMNQGKDKRLVDMSNQSTGYKVNNQQVNHNQNMKKGNLNNVHNINAIPLNNNNNNQNHVQYNNQNQNPIQNKDINTIPNKKMEVIGLTTPGNMPLSKKPSAPQNTQKENQNIFYCRKCKNQINNNIFLCGNCFKTEIINEVYSSYINGLNQNILPEQVIDGYITLINSKNEKKTLNLDQALVEFNKNFPNNKFSRKDIISEYKKRICIACLLDIKNTFIELPCKCRVCSIEHLNQYFSYYNDYSNGFYCRCKILYNTPMMFQIGAIKQLNMNIFKTIGYYFQRRLDNCCCICKITGKPVGRSNCIISLENNNYNNFLHSLFHYFCANCCQQYQNTEFDCKICQMKHFWNSN